jgi:hypothetical protein
MATPTAATLSVAPLTDVMPQQLHSRLRKYQAGKAQTGQLRPNRYSHLVGLPLVLSAASFLVALYPEAVQLITRNVTF